MGVSSNLRSRYGSRRGQLGGRVPARPGARAELSRLARHEALCRLLLGRLARSFLRRGLHHELGFARLGDYTRERLVFSAREIQGLALVAERLEDLPGIRSAFLEGVLSWTQVRLLVERATPVDEGGWVDLARDRSLRALVVS